MKERIVLSNQATFDAFSLWKNLYEQTESVWHDAIQQSLEQKSFAEGLGQFQSQYLQYQGLVNGMTESYLKQLNVPTREEIASVATLIINVEAKVDEFEDQLDNLSQENKKEIDQLKRTMARLDKKLDTVIELLSKPTTVEPTPVQTATTEKVATASNVKAKPEVTQTSPAKK